MLSTLRARKGDVIAVGVLVGLAILVFGVPAMLGRPVLPGDDLTQNYPLRVLAGQQIRSGQLPLYDPYIWGGAQLLAGWNAGAAYPLTWLFAVLPGTAAWTVGLVLTFVVAGVGMFGFLRLGPRLGTVASFAGALTFAFGGAMAAQVTHFGVVAGMSWVPLALLAVHRLTAGTGPGQDGRRARLGWMGLLGLMVGLIILAGEPRSIADGIVVVGLYAVWRVASLGRRCLPALGLVAGGIVLGGLLSAVQVLPGLAAIDTSQRAGSSLALFSSGSLPDRWLLLMLVPDLLGGSGTASQPGFFASYNLTEVDGYIGILPLVAAFALLTRLPWRAVLGRLARQGRSAVEAGAPARSRLAGLPRPSEWLVWHLMTVVGVLLALGGNTPLGGLLARLPFFGTQRLQSRNILVADLALAVLLAYWADHPFPARAARPEGAQDRTRARRLSLDVVFGALPAAAVVVVAAIGIAGGLGLFNWLESPEGASAAVIGALRPWLIPFLVLGLGALALVIFGRGLSRRVFSRLITGFVTLDIIAFSALTVVQITPATAAASAEPAPSVSSTTSSSAATPQVSARSASTQASTTLSSANTASAGSSAIPHLSVRPIANLGYQGRFVIYDPNLYDTSDLTVLQPPDLNSLSEISSVQGYTSIVDGAYATATGSHQADGEGQDTLSPAAISNGTLDSLDTTILLTLPQYASGVLNDVLTPPHWVLVGYDGGFAIYHNQQARGPLTLQPLAGGSIQGASVTDVAGLPVEPASATVTSRSGVEVVRSVADIPGWSASWRSGGSGQAVQLPVRADGVVQAVDVPAGAGVLTWSYMPPHLLAGLALSVTGTVAIGGVLLAAVLDLNLALAWRRVRQARHVLARPPARGAIESAP
ncbi:MAG TPA: hypothetical protein VMG38_20785 [Trebonia sp.]|nr:hypothetical protein [Trebonia sp.]